MLSKSNSFKLKPLAKLALLMSSGALTSALAAPGIIAEAPLYLTTGVQPNLFYMLDDSGSMNWEHIVTNRAQELYPDAPEDSIYLDPTPSEATEWREWCVPYNGLAFDPNTTYTPWYGRDSDGAVFSDVPVGAAPFNPYDTGSDTLDLENNACQEGHIQDENSTNCWTNSVGFFYVAWNDANGNDLYDAMECVPPRASIPTDGDDYYPNNVPTGGQASIVRVADMSADEKQNYANWFSYYRKREYVAKRAVSELIDASTARVGMSTLHNHGNVGVPVKDLDDKSAPLDPDAALNKGDLLSRLAQINSSSKTPLRLGLRNVGNYFDKSTNDGVGNLFGGTAHASPILSAEVGGSCQQNFAILMSDGFWNGGDPSGVGNTDAGTGPWDGGSYADQYSNTLADVAMKYYETDLAPGLSNSVPITSGVDENNAQHLVTFTVAFGIDGTLTDDPPNVIDPFAWPQPVADEATTTDDMRHAAWNGRGQFLSARNPDGLIAALGEAIKDIEKRAGSAAAVSVNSTSLQADSKVFQAKYDSGGWHGDVVAFDLDDLLAGGISAPIWQAADELDDRSLAADPRKIVTYNGAEGIPFNWPADYTAPAAGELDDPQIADLLFAAPHPIDTTDPDEIAANQTHGSNILDYLRGHHDNEGAAPGDFRPRNDHRLGDIIHSGPVFVGPPSTPYPDDIEGPAPAQLYSTFAQDKQNRDGRIYAGSNGGMLHVLDPDTGEEVFAYVPGLLYSTDDGEGLHQLAERGYTHDYYVDLTPAVADVFLDGKWRTLLVGGLRGGGKGIFVLDITDPSNLTEVKADELVLDEFSHPDLGYSFSEIQIGRLNNDRWAAIFGNGYNNSGSGRAKLFIYYFDGILTPGDPTDDFEIIDTGLGSIANGSCDDSASECNGLSTPQLADLNGDGNFDRAYAGDLWGNLWVFNLGLDENGLETTWNPRSAYPDSGAPEPLFVACTGTDCSSSEMQPITTKPTLARHKEKRAIGTWPNLMVFFGTGQYLTTSDNTDATQQRFYGVWDSGVAGLDMNDLTEQIIGTTLHAQTGLTVRTLTENTVDYSSQKGWRIDLPLSKERVVVDPIALGDVVFFNTMIPDADACSQGGSGWLMSVDQLTGGEPEFVVIDINGDAVFNGDDKAGDVIPVGIPTDGLPAESTFLPSGDIAIRLTTDSTGKIGADRVRPVPEDPARRMSWTGLQ